mgnify:CR=1 FL=1|tara:strand:- start:19924 stop:22335 length:2412 start_codon:yes stop_codon:yes gene_type:complete
MKTTQPIKTTQSIKTFFLLSSLLFFSLNFYSQNKPSKQSIDSIFLNYSASFKEVVYAHLNKSIYIKGEFIGFTAYSFSKQENKLSDKTSNLYCVIYDSNKNPIKKQLIKVENGIASGSFEIDANFEKGNYTFKAYTNWMLNFSEESFFTDSFEVLDPENTKFIERKIKSSSIDVQVLPESGHLLTGVYNTIGVVAKDNLGYGYPYLKGDVLDQNNNVITTFTLNKFGIGRFSITPKKNTTYKIVYNNGKNTTTSFVEDAKDKGIILRLNRNENYLFVSSVTNKNTLSSLKNKTYTIAYHNGKKLTKIKINFNNKSVVTKKILLDDLYKGVNIFTLFDMNNQPIAERLFFNYKNINVNTIDSFTNHIIKDTVFNFNLSFKNNVKDFNNVSVSVLPKETKSYKKNSNIISNVLIKPYIKGHLENGGYYFTNINKQKQFDLDNLLITQGWSSYDWKDLFSHKASYTHTFEKGILLNINLQNKKSSASSFFIHSLSNRPPELITFDKKQNKKSFISNDFYPINNESAYVSVVRKRNGKLDKTSLSTKFFPEKVPETNKSAAYLVPNNNFYSLENTLEFGLFKTLNTKNVLDSVVIISNLKNERINKIRNKSFGRVRFIKKYDTNLTLAEYINIRGVSFFAEDNNVGEFIVKPRNGGLCLPPVIYLDGMRQITPEVTFFRYLMRNVDYIEFNPRGIGEGTRAGAGAIYIFSKPFKDIEITDRKTLTEIKFPLSFTKAKKFYIPKYDSYKSDFYKHYGIVDWLPINKIDESGKLNLQLNNIKTNEITLFIEGVTKEGDFIYDQKTISIN